MVAADAAVAAADEAGISYTRMSCSHGDHASYMEETYNQRVASVMTIFILA